MDVKIVNMEEYLFRNYIKYDNLYGLTLRGFYAYPDSNYLNIMIDMHSLLKGLFASNTNFVFNNGNCIASSIINLAAHLKGYYRTRHKVDVKIYIIWTWNKPSHIREILPMYNAHQIMAEESNLNIRNLVEANIKILNAICNYIPNVYFIDGGNAETATVIKFIMDSPESQILQAPTLIYSRDCFQYITVASTSATTMFRPKKYMGDDRSYCVMKSNLLQSYCENELKIKWKNDLPIDYTRFVRTITYSGLIKSRGVPGVMKFKKASNFDLVNYYFTSAEEQIIKSLTMATNLDYNVEIFKTTPESLLILSNIVDYYDPKGVQELNNMMFEGCPLDLNNL